MNGDLLVVLLLQYDHKRISALSQRLIDRITDKVTQVIRNGDPDKTYPGGFLSYICS